VLRFYIGCAIAYLIIIMSVSLMQRKKVEQKFSPVYVHSRRLLHYTIENEGDLLSTFSIK